MAPRRSSDEAWLAALVAPLSVDEFLDRHWLKRHLRGHGAPDRFSSLLTWPDLNQLLEHHWRETYRFRLAMHGRDLDPASYADFDGQTPRIRSHDVVAQLRRGATLSFQGIDEVHAPLTRLAESFERLFRASANINIYAGWPSVRGLDLHRDNEQVFVLQLDGRKRWLLYGFSLDGIDASAPTTSASPPGGAVLDEILTPGDLLYIPRGCYHLAVPLTEPTLHATVSVRDPGEPGGHAKRRPSFTLPWSAAPGTQLEGADVSIVLKVPIDDIANGESGSLLQSRGHTYRFPHAMRTLLDELDDERPRPVGEIVDALAQVLDAETVRLFVAMLIKEGLVAVIS